MNIFRILSSNDGSINEPNVSSFLAYLLDPSEDHGISNLFLLETNPLGDRDTEDMLLLTFANTPDALASGK